MMQHYFFFPKQGVVQILRLLKKNFTVVSPNLMFSTTI